MGSPTEGSWGPGLQYDSDYPFFSSSASGFPLLTEDLCRTLCDSNSSAHALRANWSSPSLWSSDALQHAPSEFWHLDWLRTNERLLEAIRVVGIVGIVLSVAAMLGSACRCRDALKGLLRGAVPQQIPQQMQLVKGKLLEMKVRQLRALLQVCCFLLVPLTAWACFSDPALEGGQLACVAQYALASFALRPTIVTARTLDFVFLGATALLSLAVTPWLCQELELLQTLLLGNGLMALLVAVRRTGSMGLPVLALACGLFGTASAGCIVVRGYVVFGKDRLAFAALQGVLVALLLLAAPLLEWRSRAWLFKVMELEELQGLLGASQGLLRSCFDVVVELDGAGRLVSGGQELGGLLLRQGVRSSMQGEAFAELIEGEEVRAAFERRLQGPPSAAELGLAESMHVAMRDACGNRLSLEIMWFAFRPMESSGRHVMLGLREAAAERAPAAEQEHIMVAAPTGRGVQKDRLHAIDVCLSEASSVPEDQSVSSGSALEAGATLLADPNSAGITVKKTSASFRARVSNIPPGEQLTSILMRPQAFVRWLTNGRMQEGRRDCYVAFKLPQGKVMASCKAVRQEENGEVLLLFYGIRLEAQGPGTASHSGMRHASPKRAGNRVVLSSVRL